MSRKVGRPKVNSRRKLQQLQLRVPDLYCRRINQMAMENYSTTSQVLRSIVIEYFRMKDGKKARPASEAA